VRVCMGVWVCAYVGVGVCADGCVCVCVFVRVCVCVLLAAVVDILWKFSKHQLTDQFPLKNNCRADF